MKTVQLPTFLIAGAQKSGTTSLHNYLSMHPAVYLSEGPQELHFFDMEQFFNKGVDCYKQHFPSVREDHRAIGQTSPEYIYEPKVPSRIASLLPQVKLIFILRDPIKRAYSHYWHAVKRGFENLPFEKALEREAHRITQNSQKRREFSYVDRGYYARQLERYLQYFDREQMLILLLEEMNHDPVGVINKCCDFLNIEQRGSQIIIDLPKSQWNSSRLPRFQFIQRLTTPWREPWYPGQSSFIRKIIWQIDKLNLKDYSYPKMNSKTRKKLVTLFEPENKRLTKQFNIDLSVWSDIKDKVSIKNN